MLASGTRNQKEVCLNFFATSRGEQVSCAHAQPHQITAGKRDRGGIAHRRVIDARQEWDTRNRDLVASAANSGASNVTNRRPALPVCGEVNVAASPNSSIPRQQFLADQLMQQGKR